MLLDGMDRTKRMELLLSIALGIAFVGYLCAIYFGNLDTEVVRDRYWKDAEPLFNGEIPIIEYPPLALVFFAIPRIFFSSPMGYDVGYVIMTYIFTIIGMELIRRIAERCGFSQWWSMLVYSVLMVLMLQFITDRYDIIPAIMTLGAFYLLLTKRTAFAFILLALAMMTKLYPAIFLPVFLMTYFVRKEWKEMFMGLFWFIVGTLIVVVPCMLIDSDLVFGFLGYHTARPLEVGSMPATLIYPFSMLGITDTWIMPATMEGSYGSDDLRGPWCDGLAPFLTPLMGIVIITLILFYGHLRSRTERVDERIFYIVSTLTLTLITFMLIGKVFSSQYLIWAIPFLTIVVAMIKDRKTRWRILWTAILSFALTQINFLYIFGITGGGENITDLAMISMLVRNLMILAIGVMIFKEMLRVSREGYGGEDSCKDIPFGF